MAETERGLRVGLVREGNGLGLLGWKRSGLAENRADENAI